MTHAATVSPTGIRPAFAFGFRGDFGSVFDAAGVERAPLLGISQGAAVSVTYAVQNPQRVSALVLVGGCARGWATKRHPKLTERMQALMVLMRQGWGLELRLFGRSSARRSFRTPLAPTRIGSTSYKAHDSPENAAEMLLALGNLDVRDEPASVSVPTLVVHQPRRTTSFP